MLELIQMHSTGQKNVDDLKSISWNSSGESLQIEGFFFWGALRLGNKVLYIYTT